MSNIAKIAVSAAIYSIDKPYSYAVRPGLSVMPGVRVMVPFGRGDRMAEGIVLSVEEGNEAELKWVEQALDTVPVLSAPMLRLAAFLRERYFCTFYEAARAMLPAGLWFQVKEEYALVEGAPWEGAMIRQEDGKKLLQLLLELGGRGEFSQLSAAMGDEERCRNALRYLKGKKWLTAETHMKSRVKDKTQKVAALAVPAQEAMDYVNRKGRSALAQKAVLELLSQLGSCSVKELCYYTGATTATVNRLEKLGFVVYLEQEVFRCREIKPMTLSGPLTLNEEQEQAFLELKQRQARENPGVALLYGITGSGKTMVYIKLIAHTLSQGKTAVLLVPEIALTPQLLSLMAAYFGEDVAVLHSSLSVGERYDQWKRARDGSARLVIGTRSAVFAPCENLGLLIVDEEQEHSYKSENSPRYCAKEAAIYRGYQTGALVLLGSATPSVETMHRAKTGIYSLHCLRGRYNGRSLPRVDIVDMKQELRQGNDSVLSEPLRQALWEKIEKGEQAVLFLNRRGASRMMQCVSCGEVPECPRCSVRLTYHSANGRLMCHYCGYSIPMHRRCPACNGLLKEVGAGTQRVQQDLEMLFPGVKVARMDADTVSAANTHEMILERFQKEKMHILLGTQMITKGLNLPNVTLVGVLDADLSLYVSSYRAAETTFNMLTQVVGRAGRGEKPGTAMIQTMTPAHQVINLAAQQDYDSFFDLEIGLRQIKGCPPFGDIYTITFFGLEEQQVMSRATVFRDRLGATLAAQPQVGQTILLGPAPAVIGKVNYHYRYCLTLRASGSKLLRQLLAQALKAFPKEKENKGVSLFVDVNGYE